MSGENGRGGVQIAVYGKGGIGKSTMSANISAALSMSGKNVLQIGCDPKHDSTRLLLHGSSSKTVLDYMKEVRPTDRKLEDVMHAGYGGVKCVEAGGPEPGVGCAGRGILSTFDLLRDLGLDKSSFDVIIYDVLGDVVCGGFAVPLRREFADAVLLVTSGEYMAIYAANNILRGIKNHDGNTNRVAGVLFNSRGLASEFKLVRDFAEAIHLPILMTIPRSEEFASAERRSMTVIELSPGGTMAKHFFDMAGLIGRLSDGNVALYPARPLSDDQLERLLRGLPLSIRTEDPVAPIRTKEVIGCHHEPHPFAKSIEAERKVVYGCAFAGAVVSAMQLKGSIVIAHGPRSCSHIISSLLVPYAWRSFSGEGGTPLDFVKRFRSTDLCDSDYIYGGGGRLENEIKTAIADGSKNIFIITTCPAGLIGDDIETIVRRIRSGSPDVNISPICTDGNVAGDFSRGILEACVSVSNLIDLDIAADDRLVNIVGEKNLASNKNCNFGIVKGLLDEMGLRINCRYLNDTTPESVRMFKRARFNLAAQDDETTVALKKHLSKMAGVEFISRPFPFGFKETSEWLREIGARTCSEDKAENIIRTARSRYDTEIQHLSRKLSGKKIMITSHNPRVNWIIDLVEDLKMDLVMVGLSSDAESGTPSRYPIAPIRFNYEKNDRASDIAKLGPDIVVSNYSPSCSDEPVRFDIIPLCPDVGFWTGIEMAERWARTIQMPPVEGWRKDGVFP